MRQHWHCSDIRSDWIFRISFSLMILFLHLGKDGTHEEVWVHRVSPADF